MSSDILVSDDRGLNVEDFEFLRHCAAEQLTCIQHKSSLISNASACDVPMPMLDMHVFLKSLANFSLKHYAAFSMHTLWADAARWNRFVGIDFCGDLRD